MAAGIYSITNTLNGHKYIGSAISVSRRWKGHINHLNANTHHSAHLQSAWNKYGADCFEFTVLERCEKERLIEREQFYIDLEQPVYNMSPTAGSSLGIKRSEETRRRLSEAKKGKPSPRKGVKLSEETRAKISEAQIGRKHTDETRAKMRASSRHTPPTEEHKAKLSELFTGKPLSEEHCKKLSIAHMGNQSGHGNLGNKLTEEHKAKVSQAVTEWWRKRKEVAHV